MTNFVLTARRRSVSSIWSAAILRSDGDYIWFTRKTANSSPSSMPILAWRRPRSGWHRTSYVCFDGTYILGREHRQQQSHQDQSQPTTPCRAAPTTCRILAASASTARRCWVCSFSANTVLKLDPRNGSVLGTFPVGAQPEAICFDGSSIWVANQGANNVTRLDSTAQSSAPTRSKSHRAGIVFDGRAIWVSNSGSNTVSQLDYNTGQVLGTYPVGTSPTGVSFDGNAVWIANKTSNTLQRR